MKYLAALFCTAFVAIGGLNAQDSQAILNDLSKKAQTYSSISADYDSRLLDEQAGLDISQKGSIKVSGEKYNLDMADYTIISDGESVWTFEKETNTCYADYVEDMEDGSFSPGEMFTIWEQDFKNEYKGSTTVDGASCHQINLYPNNPVDKPYHTIQLYIDKSKMEVAKIVVKGREGNDMIYVVKNFNPNAAVGDADFKFSEAAFPGCELIDNR